MEDQLLLKIALCISIIGIISLSLISYYTEVPEVKISNIENTTFQNIKITGTVNKIQTQGSITKISVSQPISVEAVAFDIVEGVEEGDIVVITAEKQKVRGETQLIVDSIKKKITYADNMQK